MKNLRNIRSQGEINAKLGGCSAFAVMLEQPFSYVARRHPNDGIFSSVVSRGSRKQFQPDYTLLQCLKAAGYGLLNNISEESSATIAPPECLAFDNLLNMPAQCRGLFFRPSDVHDRSFALFDWVHTPASSSMMR